MARVIPFSPYFSFNLIVRFRDGANHVIPTLYLLAKFAKWYKFGFVQSSLGDEILQK
jgi:hypothetical protein